MKRYEKHCSKTLKRSLPADPESFAAVSEVRRSNHTIALQSGSPVTWRLPGEAFCLSALSHATVVSRWFVMPQRHAGEQPATVPATLNILKRAIFACQSSQSTNASDIILLGSSFLQSRLRTANSALQYLIGVMLSPTSLRIVPWRYNLHQLAVRSAAEGTPAARWPSPDTTVYVTSIMW